MKRFDRGVVAPACAIAAVSLLMAGGAYGYSSHDPWKLKQVRIDGLPITDENVTGACDSCHTLDVPASDPNGGYMQKYVRTMSQMRSANGGVVPANFGCTFCHSSVSDNIYMKNGLKDFEFTAVGYKHPVGVTVTGTETSDEYLSTFNTSPQADRLNCIDCHEPALLFPSGQAGYPYHEGRVTDPAPWTGSWNKATNPYALRNVAALGEERNKHCVNTCHGASVPDTDTTPRMGHVGWGGYREVPPGSGIFKMYEPRGGEIRQSDCGVCHEPHTSTKAKLISDGLRPQTTGVNTPPTLPDVITSPKAAIVETNCTAVCHEGGDPNSDFEQKGHGKAKDREGARTMNYKCSGCHDSGVPHRDPLNPKRFGFTEETAISGIPHDGSNNKLDDDYDGQVDEPDEATWKNKALSICQSCHSEYYAHGGDLNGLSTIHLKTAGCLDCHDPHGRDVGNNIELIRTSIAGEETVFQYTTDNGTLGWYDFYRVGNGVTNGVCDNTTCHGGRDLETILADPKITDHKGIGKGDNCTGCHTHTSLSAAPSFKPLCDTCHGYPPASGGLPDYQQGIGVHQRHVTDLHITCSECHYRDLSIAADKHNEANWEQNPGYAVPRGLVDVVFDTHDGTVNVGASYSGYNKTTGTMDTSVGGAIFTCNNITCHNPDSGTPNVGLTHKNGTTATNNAPEWKDGFDAINVCTGCHVESPATNPDLGSHYKHDNKTTGRGFDCQICHATYYDAAKNFDIAGGMHGNGSLDTTGLVNFTGTLTGTLTGQAVTGTWDDNNQTCANAYCHGDTMPGPDVTAPVWGSNTPSPGGRCGDCHDTDTASDPVDPKDTISTGNHTAHLTAVFGPNTNCDACHPAYALKSTTHVNGSKDFQNLAPGNLIKPLGLTDTCNNCHGSSKDHAKDPTNWGNGSYKIPCLECHDGSANSARNGTGVTAQNEDTNWTTTGHGRPTASGTYSGTLHGQPGPGYGCTVCHDQTATHINGTLGTTDRFKPVVHLNGTLSDVTEVCLDCHLVGQTTAPVGANHLNQDAKAEATVHSGFVTGNYRTHANASVAFAAYGDAAITTAPAGYQCEACHNPHGTTKIAMIKPKLDGMFGSPTPESNPIDVGAAFNYSGGTLAGLDPTAGANDGVCDACHRNTGTNTNAHPDSVKPNNHNQGQVCVACHDHKKSFFAGCADCHGGSQTGTTRKNYWPDGLVAPNTAGAHADHIADLARRIYNQSVTELLNDAASDARQKHLCKYCHGLDPGERANHGYMASMPAQVSANLGRIWDVANPPTLTDAVTYLPAPGAKTCATVECHYNTLTAGWESGTAATCTTCHNNGTNDGALSNSWPDIPAIGTGDHFAHYTALGTVFNTLYGATNTICIPCHNTQQPAVGFANIASMATHMNGSRYTDVSFPNSFNDKSEGTADVVAYTPAATPNENNGTCANVSCHGGSSIGPTPAWRDGTITTTTVITAQCQLCHQRVESFANPYGTEFNDARSGAHIDHDYGCGYCHSAAPTNHYNSTNIATGILDNATNIGSTYFTSYSDTTMTLNGATNAHFNGSATLAGVSGTCNAVTCHYGLSPTWSYTVATCGFCHLDSPISNAHQAHIYNGSTPDHTDCDQCHPSAPPNAPTLYADAVTGTDGNFLTGLHANGTVEKLSTLTTVGTGPTLTCTTNPCHVRERATTTWDNTTSPLSCNSCHYAPNPPTAVAAAAGNAGGGAIGGSHNSHFFGAPTNIVCADCHTNPTGDTGGVLGKRTHMNNTGGTDGAVLVNKAQALQNEADVLPAVMTVAGDPDPGNPICNNGLCHNPTSGGAFSATWTGTVTSCAYCHADTSQVPNSGSHAKHINYASGYAPCTQCHPNNVAYTHMNRSVDMGVTYAGAVTPPYDSSSWGSCSTGSCHNATAGTNIDWGGTPTDCKQCHYSNTADTNDFNGSNRAASMVYATDYTAATTGGHGKTSGPSINKGCVDCHDISAATTHDNSTALSVSANPFRLVDQVPGGSLDFSCSLSSCHPATNAGKETGVLYGDIKSHTQAGMEFDGNFTIKRSWPVWKPRCTECHDPHGDGLNKSMIQSDLYDKGSAVQGSNLGSQDWGVPTLPNDNNGLVFTDNTTGVGNNSYAWTNTMSPTYSGLCQECHEGVDPNQIVAFKDNNSASIIPHTVTTDCSQCHKHDKGFRPAGCNGCHGDPVVKNYWPDTASQLLADYPDRAGAHAKHVEAISVWLGYGNIATLLAEADPVLLDTKQKAICTWCHPQPGLTRTGTGEGSHADNNYANGIDLHNDSRPGTTTSYYQYFSAPATSVNDTNGVFTQATGLCANINCHNNNTTPTSWLSPPTWNTTSCGTNQCHVTAGASGGHVAHYDGAQMGYACSQCHVVPATLTHADGSVNLSFTNAGSLEQVKGAGNGYYDKNNSGTNNAGDNNFVPYYESGTAASVCYNMYCHGGDNAGWGGTDTTPVWNDYTTATCFNGSCHPAYGSAYSAAAVTRHQITTGSHTVHFAKLNSSGISISDIGPQLNKHAGCSACHNSQRDDGSPPGSPSCLTCHRDEGAPGQGVASKPTLTHVNGSVDFRSATFSTFYTDPAQTIGATPSCDKCHSTANVGGNIGTALAKSYWGTASRVPCLNCHNVTTPAINMPFGPPDETSVSAPAKDAYYATVGHGKVTNSPYGGKACEDCHDENSAHVSGTLGDSDRLNAVNGQTPGTNGFCSSACHTVIAATVHYNNSRTTGGTSDSGDQCLLCHDPHAVSGQDAMITGSIAGKNITGFTNRTQRSSYYSTTPGTGNNYGICQSCHDQSEVLHFNRTREENATHFLSPGVCTTCHTHTTPVAFSFDCTKCHGNVGGNVYPPAGPTIARSGGTLDWAERASLPSSVGHHDKHIASYGIGANGCALCHTTTPGVDAAHFTNKTNATMTGIATYGSWTPGGQTGNLSVVDDTCANMTCHDSTYGAPQNVYQSAANPGYVRYWDSNLDCYSCHAYDGSNSAIRPGSEADDVIATGSHTDHVVTYAMTCTECHTNNAGNNAHKNGSVNFAANFGVTRLGANTGGHYDTDGIVPWDPGPVPSQATRTWLCADAFCHSTGEPRGVETRVFSTATEWGVAATANCGTCHGVDGVLGTMTTNVHEKHTGSAAGRYGFRCETCHYGIFAWGGSSYTVVSLTLHVNNTNNVVFAPSMGSYTPGVAPAGGDCSATYCHSQGLDWTAPYTTQSSNAPKTTPDWDSGDGSLTCSGCHGDGGAIAYPTYVTNTLVNPGLGDQQKKNSHVEHAGLTCNNCHSGTTSGAALTITSTALHTNGSWDLAQGNGATFTVSAYGNMTGNIYTPTTCTVISCHNGGAATWGAKLMCSDCHFAAADVNNWDILAIPPAAISSTEWTTTGHGRTTAFPGGNPAANFGGSVPATDTSGCAYCHDPSVQHKVTTNPFRLANKSGALEDQGWNNVCLVCHKTGDAGYAPVGAYGNIDGTKDVDENHYGTKHGDSTKGGTFCWDCHDPHGDGQHLMVHSGNGTSPGLGVTDVSDGTYGWPVSSREVTGLNVSDGYTSADLVNAGNTGLCQTCHAVSGGANYFTRNLYTDPATHNGADGTLCTLCHAHSKDFAPEPCESCHDKTPFVRGSATAPNVMGNGNSLIGTGLSTPKPYDDGQYGYNVNGHGRDNDTNGTSHGNSINVACIACHNLALPTGTHLDGTLNGRITPVDTRNANSFHLVSPYIKASPTSEEDVQVTFDNYCSSQCHGVGIQMRHALDPTPLNAVQFGTHTTYAEPLNTTTPFIFYDRNLKYLGPTYDPLNNHALCVSCHDPHGTSLISPRGDGNNKMVLDRWMSPATLCARCHQ